MDRVVNQSVPPLLAMIPISATKCCHGAPDGDREIELPGLLDFSGASAAPIR